MTNEEYIILANKVAEGTASMRELAFYNAAYESFQQEQNSLTEMGLNPQLLKKQSLQRFWNKQEVPRSKTKLWPRIAAAASIAIAISAGIWFYASSRHPDAIQASKTGINYANNDISPGKNAASITLGNGETISLSSAKTGVVINEDDVTYNDGSTIKGSNEKISKTNILTLTTPRGGTYDVVLPDGTKAWLNSDSRMSFPAQFSGKTRKIMLTGEAYFEVAKDKKHPFIVQSNQQEVEVLGTHFNIRSYTDTEGTKTTLLEGSVKVSVFGANKRQEAKATAVLKPNQQAYVANQSIKVNTVDDAKTAVAWKEGYFRFNDAGIESVMLELSRWYNIEVVYQGEITRDGFNGKISRFKNISDVLKMLEETRLVHFKIEGRRIIVLK